MTKSMILLLVGAGPALGQSIGGTVTSASSKAVIGNADVVVLDQARSAILSAATPANGAFAFAVRPGRYYVRVVLIGYKTFETPVLHVVDAPIRIDVALEDSVIPISGVTAATRARSRRLEATGLYERMKEARGAYILRDEIENRHAERISQLVSGRGGLRVHQVTRGASSGITRGDLVMRGGIMASTSSSYCFPRVYLDGVLARPSSTSAPTLTLDEIAKPEEIEGIEIYRSSSQIPAQFSGADSSCGVVLIWTRTS